MTGLSTVLRRCMLRLMGLLLGGHKPHPSAPTPAHILIIKPDHAGDLLLFTPALAVLRQRLPHASITLMVGPWNVDLLKGSPLIDHLETCQFPGFTRQAKPGLLQPYLLLVKMALVLRLVHYDVVLIARDDHWWGALLARLAGIPHRTGFAVPDVAPFLTTALPHDPRMHVAAQGVALVEALTGYPLDVQPTTHIPVSEVARAWAALRLPKDGLGHPLVAIHPGAGGVGKLWLPERWIEVARTLETRGIEIVLTGGPGERDLVDRIAHALTHPVVILDAPSLQFLAAIFARCSLVLGVDSGPLHVAVAAGVRTLALFGPGDPGRFGPWGPPAEHPVVRSGLWCSPCGVLDHCPRGTMPSECMTQIPTDHVITAADFLFHRE